MADENLAAGQVYAVRVINLWLECLDLSHQARMCWLQTNYDHDVNCEYVARLTRLWLELYPKIQGRADMKDFVTEYEKFQVFYRSPDLIKNSPEDIIRLEEVIRTALEKLGLTKF
jgi:hypothetical protein